MKLSDIQSIPQTTHYVNSSKGSDGNSGRSPADAWASLQHAVNIISKINHHPAITSIKEQK